MKRFTVYFFDGAGPLAKPVDVPSGEAIFWSAVGDCCNNCMVTQKGSARPLLPGEIDIVMALSERSAS